MHEQTKVAVYARISFVAEVGRVRASGGRPSAVGTRSVGIVDRVVSTSSQGIGASAMRISDSVAAMASQVTGTMGAMFCRKDQPLPCLLNPEDIVHHGYRLHACHQTEHP